MNQTVSSVEEPPMLVSIGGLPATGKTTIARVVVSRRRAAYVRVDTIEAAIAASEGVHEASNDWELPPGYVVGAAVAADQLRSGLDVVVESVNPSDATRDGWAAVGQKTGARLLEVEIVCSDVDEHRRRAEGRGIDVPEISAPTWPEILDRAYQSWSREHLVIDTAQTDAEAAASLIEVAIGVPVWPGEARVPSTSPRPL